MIVEFEACNRAPVNIITTNGTSHHLACLGEKLPRHAGGDLPLKAFTVTLRIFARFRRVDIFDAVPDARVPVFDCIAIDDANTFDEYRSRY